MADFPPTLEVRNLACARGDRLLFKDMNFSVRAGELLLVQGGNGQGKTSLLRLLTGLARPEDGQILWRGEPIRQQSERYHTEMIYLGHANGVKDDLNPVENLRFADGLQGRRFDSPRAIATLQRLGLERCLDLPCRVLSFGQRRRVALASLLLAGATLWILDEPLTGLDVHAVALMETLIHDHLGTGGLVVATTHQALNLENVKVQRLLVGKVAIPDAAPPPPPGAEG